METNGYLSQMAHYLGLSTTKHKALWGVVPRYGCGIPPYRELAFKGLNGNQIFVHIKCFKECTWLGKNRHLVYINNLPHHVQIRTTTNHNGQHWSGLEENIYFASVFGMVSQHMSLLDPSPSILCTTLKDYLIHYQVHDHG
jgi:hypothetical protein